MWLILYDNYKAIWQMALLQSHLADGSTFTKADGRWLYGKARWQMALRQSQMADGSTAKPDGRWLYGKARWQMALQLWGRTPKNAEFLMSDMSDNHFTLPARLLALLRQRRGSLLPLSDHLRK